MPENDGIKLKDIVDPAAQDDVDVVMGGDGVKPDDGSSSAVQRELSEDSLSHDSICGETSRVAPIIQTIITASEDEPSPLIRVIPPAALALQVQSPGPSAARKSPVTVQEWVDSLPPPRMREDNTPEPWPTPRPDGLKREASVQSDAGSHCSSVESLLGSRRPDPEEILLGLGFGGTSNDLDSDVARIPKRFLRPSKVKGVAIDDFLKHQHDLVQTFESGFFGYRGLTGPGYRTPSVIVAKIMEKLRVGKSTSASPPSTPGKRFSRAARKVMNVLPSSVLTPDNRQFLDDQGGKSPEVPRKKMIIGQRSFTFDGDGHMLELRKSPIPGSQSGSDEAEFVPDMSSTVRSFSDDSDSGVIAPGIDVESSVTAAPAFSTSSRSASVDSSDAASLSQLSWDLPRLGGWDAASPKTDFPRNFTRYESIEETPERDIEAPEEPVSAVQHRRGSLKRQHHVDELSADLGLQTLPESRAEETLLVGESSDSQDNSAKLPEILSSEETMDVVREKSPCLEEIVNPCRKIELEKNLQLRPKPAVEEKKTQRQEEKKVEETRQEVVEPLCRREMRRGTVAPLLRVRSDSSGFLDQDVGDCTGMDQEQSDLDELVLELKRRGLQATNCRDTAVRLAVGSYGMQLRRDTPDSDLMEARCDIEALRRLRELVAIELRRVADLLDEQPTATGLPTITSQMTALLRQQTRLRRQLESLSDESSQLACLETPSCCEVLSLVQDSHRNLASLIERNSQELADIRKLLHDMVVPK